MEVVEGPGLRDEDEAAVLPPQHLLLPQQEHPEEHQQERHGEAARAKVRGHRVRLHTGGEVLEELLLLSFPPPGGGVTCTT